MILTDLKTTRKCLKLVPDMGGQKEIEEEFSYFDRISTVRGDSTGIGDFPWNTCKSIPAYPSGRRVS